MIVNELTARWGRIMSINAAAVPLPFPGLNTPLFIITVNIYEPILFSKHDQ